MDKPSEPKKDEETSSGNRLIKLTEDETKSLGDYKNGEATCTVTGTMTGDGMFRVMTVNPASEAKEETGGVPPNLDEMMRSMMPMRQQVTPSPS